MSNYINWTRGNNRPLSAHFNATEFTCSCGVCRPQRVQKELIDRLEEVRALYGKPIRVTSGFRCAVCQQALRKAGYETSTGISTHELAEAADITGQDLPALLKAVDAVFDTYGVARSFIHVDLRPKRPDGTKRTWTYRVA